MLFTLKGYHTLFSLLIGNWRMRSIHGEFIFLVVHLANHEGRAVSNAWATNSVDGNLYPWISLPVVPFSSTTDEMTAMPSLVP